jgi:exopolysaccharide biosynthesis polyprenyl glycosylphosphotransferase
MALDQSYALSAVEERTAPAHFLPQRVQRTRLERLLQGRTWTALRVGFDVLLVAFAVGVTVLRAPSASADEIWLAALLAPLMIGTLTLGGLYKHDFQVKIVDGVGRVIGATTLAAAATITAAATGTTQLESHALIPHTWAAASVLLVVGRVFTNWVERRARAAGVIATPTLIVGAGQIGALVERRLTSERELGLHPVGYLDADPPEQEDVPLRTAPVLGRPEEVGRVAELTGAKHVVIGFTRDPDSQLFDVMRDCEERKLQVSVVPRFFEFVNVHSELEHIGGLPLFSHESTDPKSNTFAVKHAFDRVAAGLMLLILLPVLLTVAAAVKLSSPGPVLFRQRRIGRDGRHFELLKFRSMRMADPVAAEDTLTLLPTDMAPGGVEGMDRRTRVGAFLRRNSIDELPQLINVLCGDMSLVGPRPERPEFVEIFEQRVRRYDDRHRVKSGITGFAQINGLRGRTSLSDRVELDNHYISNWSLSLDLRILFLTLGAVLMRREE